MLETLVTTALNHSEPSIEPKVLLRTASIYQSGTYASAVGGFLQVKTPLSEHFKAQVRMVTSQLVPTISGKNSALNTDLIASNLTSYTNVNVANINYSIDDLMVSIGRIVLDTPYADSDDIRMTSNTFEGFMTKWSRNDTTVLQFFGANAMSGFDAAAQETFSELSPNSVGFLALSGEFTLGLNHKIAVWDYYADAMANILYGTYDYSIAFDTGATLGALVEFSNMQELDHSGIAGTVLGLGIEASHKGFTLDVNYEHLFATPFKVITNGFGGGPYQTAMYETTLASVSQNAVGLDVDAISFAASKVINSVEVGYEIGYFKAAGTNISTVDYDITVGWNFAKDWTLEGTLQHLDNVLTTNSETMNRAFFRMDYTYN